MKRITYISKYAKTISDDDFKRIEEVAIQNNRQLNVTGALVSAGGIFFQIIEGENEVIDTLFVRISNDDRHTDILCLKTEFGIKKRLFPDWSMKTINLDLSTDILIQPIKILLQNVAEAHQIIEKYTQPNVLEILSRGINPLNVPIQKTDKIILFSDIMAFSTLSENFSAEEIVFMLNAYLDICSRNISQGCGQVTKFIGDCVMAHFEPQKADNAIWACINILSEVAKLRQAAPKNSILSSLYCGFGLSQGQVIEGNIGSAIKMDYTIIGDSVNTAARLEALTRKLENWILLSSTVKESAWQDWKFIDMGEHRLAGKSESTNVYTISHDQIHNYKSKAEITNEIQNA